MMAPAGRVVFPAYAGVILERDYETLTTPGLSRIRGGDPTIGWLSDGQ